MSVQYGIEENEWEVEGFGMPETQVLKNLLSRLVHSYVHKTADIDDVNWLKATFIEELPALSESDAESFSKETIDEIAVFEENRKSLSEARKHGMSAEQWFMEESSKAAVGVSVQAFAGKLTQLDQTLQIENLQLEKAVTTKYGIISQNNNLDGFIAEQYHVSSFNTAATLAGSPFRAERLSPDGKAFGRNSFDLVIRDADRKIVHQYQCKYGEDAKATIQLIRDGNYNNQTLLVPPEQLEQVQSTFPGKTVVAQIGGTDAVAPTSMPLSKEQAKITQLETQGTDISPQMNWSTYEAKALALHVGKHAMLAGVQGAALGAGFHLAAKLITEDAICAEDVVEAALQTGADTGIKAAAAGALKIAAERGSISILPPGTPVQILANISCVAIENIKILSKIAAEKISMTAAIDEMGCNTVTMVYGLSWSAAGASYGAFALGWIPIVGSVVGGVIGGCVGYMAGSKFGEAICASAKRLAQSAKTVARNLWDKAKSQVATGREKAWASLRQK